MDVVSLLQSKNRCLQKFLNLSLQFLKSAEQGDFSTLDDFQSRREATIKALDLYDRKISESVATLAAETDRAALADSITPVLEERNRVIEQILRVDDRIMSQLDQEKRRIAEEMAQSRKNQANLMKFKSAWMPESGEGLDEKL